MKVLVIGGGGREHAIIKSLNKSRQITKLYAANGNAGIAKDAICLDIKPSEYDKICSFAKENAIDLVVVAPDNPLSDGLVDMLNAINIKTFGPTKAAAEIESSKVFSKNLMKKYNIPTAAFEHFDNFSKALEYAKGQKLPLVVKADGLAYGKGVIICQTMQEVENALSDIMQKGAFGSAGNRVVIEEFLTGPEVSVLIFTDGKSYKNMITSCDHKRVFDNDQGLNTGGMGTFAPCPFYTQEIEAQVNTKIIEPTLKAMQSQGREFSGVLYFGLIKTDSGMKVIEYNARFGDPETQVILPMLKTDLLTIFLAVADKKLDQIDLQWHSGASVCVMLASGGYPQEYKTGKTIQIGQLEKDIILYHSGTAQHSNNFVTAGGRVLGVCARAENLGKARQKVYQAIKQINFEGMHYRTDIGKKHF